jgi:hypothetical protein
MERRHQSEYSFNIEKEYVRCIAALNRIGILKLLPGSGSIGVTGKDGKEYPVPTMDQVAEIFHLNRELAGIKVLQGFDHLELTPMEIPVYLLIDRMKAAILEHAAEGKIYQTRRSSSDPLLPVHVNTEKHVWIWDTLSEVLDREELVYFPKNYSANHLGQTKSEAVNNGFICAVPGWSVGLAENLPIMPQQGNGKIIGGRRQLETGYSPRDYLQTLKAQSYLGETGKTLEDFITEFLTRLETMNEISNDRHDGNALWLLGQYVKYVTHLKSDLVPTGWWHQFFGRVRLDAHRPGNKLCTRNWGVSTIVRLHRHH